LPGARKQQPKLAGVVEALRNVLWDNGKKISIERLFPARDSRVAAFGGERAPSEGNKSRNERTKRIVEGEWRSQKRELKLRLEKGRIDRRTEEEARSQQRWRGAQI
jgi:hypothetical protein